MANIAGSLVATGLLVMSLPYESFLDLVDNDAGSKLPDEFSEFFPVLTVELVGTLFIYLAFLFIHSPESNFMFKLTIKWNSPRQNNLCTMDSACVFSRQQGINCLEVLLTYL